MASTTGSFNPATPTTQTRFLGSHNPQQLKRTVLASFTDVLLLPVTIVPRTVNAVGAALVTGGEAAVQGISMLNPQRWVTQNTGGGPGYSKNFEKDGAEMVFDLGADEDDLEDEKGLNEGMYDSEFDQISPEKLTSVFVKVVVPSSNAGGTSQSHPGNRSSTSSSLTLRPQKLNGDFSHSSGSANTSTTSFDQLELLLSLDTALELIHADREALKRVETFSAYPGRCGHRVRDTIEEVFILLLRAMGEGHINPGFER